MSFTDAKFGWDYTQEPCRGYNHFHQGECGCGAEQGSIEACSEKAYRSLYVLKEISVLKNHVLAKETLELRDLVEIVPEPVEKWQNIGQDQFNILDAFYAEPEKESSGGIKPLRLMERSLFSDRMVFVRASCAWINQMWIGMYDSWFDPVVSSLSSLIPDGFIYLRASPDTCHKLMMLRKRAEEGGVSLDYLRGLHEKQESWLFPFQRGHHGVLSVSKLPNSSVRLSSHCNLDTPCRVCPSCSMSLLLVHVFKVRVLV